MHRGHAPCVDRWFLPIEERSHLQDIIIRIHSVLSKSGSCASFSTAVAHQRVRTAAISEASEQFVHRVSYTFVVSAQRYDCLSEEGSKQTHLMCLRTNVWHDSAKHSGKGQLPQIIVKKITSLNSGIYTRKRV